MQTKSDEDKERYYEIRNEAKAIVREAHKISWETFINRVESDLYGRQVIT